MDYKTGETFRVAREFRDPTGYPMDTGVLSAMTALLYKNGASLGGAVAVTCSNPLTGVWECSGTMPSANEGDTFRVVGSATIDGAAQSVLIGEPFGILSQRPSDVYSRLGAPVAASISADLAAVSTKIGTPTNGSVAADNTALASLIATCTTAVSNVASSVTTVLNRIGALAGSGDNTILGMFLAMFRSDAPLPTQIAGTYNPAVHSLQVTSIAAVSGAQAGAANASAIAALQVHGDDNWAGGDSNVGPGSIATTITVNDSDGAPVSGAEVWISTDAGGSNVIAGTLITNDFGIVVFMLDAGAYYVWRDSPAFNFTNPQSITVS